MAHPLDLIDAFAVLEAYGIPVVRTQYVDSAENAIVFANRRPIMLYGLRPDRRRYEPSLVEKRLRTDVAIRGAYRRLAASSGARLLAQAEVEPGTDTTLAGERAEDGRILRFVTGAHEIERRCPLTESEAETMLDEVRSKRALGSNEKAVRTLAHLFVKVAKMYDETGITSFVLHVRVHDNGYKVMDATMDTERAPHLTHRLKHHAHDRKSYDYHPSGRQ